MSLLLHIILPVSVLIFGLDRLSKIWIVEWLDLKNLHSLEAFPPYLNLRMAWNTGINFGIPVAGPLVLIALSVVISAALLWWVLRRNERTLAFGAGAVIGGALGNAWDRWEYGAVADFLNMSCCGFNNPFSFNIADIAIFAGAVWIAFRA